jgi:hypothetical protein
MKYVLLLYSDPSAAASMTPEEIQARRAEVMPQWVELFEYLEKTAKSVEGTELDDPPSAKTLRREDGEIVVTDGPFAETKEQIGGLFFIECENLDEAIDMAARVPLASRGSVEIRPVVE